MHRPFHHLWLDFQHLSVMIFLKLAIMNFNFGNYQFTSDIVKKLKNDSNSAKTCCVAKFNITNLLNLWVSGFLSMNGNGKFQPSKKIVIDQNFQLLTPTPPPPPRPPQNFEFPVNDFLHRTQQFILSYLPLSWHIIPKITNHFEYTI